MSKIGVVCGSFHEDEVKMMLDTVKSTIEDQALLGSWGELMEPVWVPGAFEVPLATKRLLDAGCVGVVTLGIIERGQTLHGQAMGDAVMAALIDLQLEYNRPIGLGIIGPGADPEHIEPRLVPHARAAIEAVVHMLNVRP
ncbi:MAG: 6,7-dimethyl-8-ribityllumazine synthase [Candidatus Thermoplasmatota archaeon]|nr:6,7-dimethyl-8-ribityllumazine synthase [Candidatus Thermoplasmatota archaeon]